MRSPPVEEPFYAVAARCLSRLAELGRGRLGDPADIAAAPAEDSDRPILPIIGFLSGPVEF